VSKGTTADKQGIALGVSASLLALSNALAPLLAGIISGSLGLAAPFVAAGLLILVGWTVLQIYPRYPMRTSGPSSAFGTQTGPLSSP
jgi:predicted MFS family arabinose efflux permease